MIHFAVQPKVTLHCKATLLQLKKKIQLFFLSSAVSSYVHLVTCRADTLLPRTKQEDKPVDSLLEIQMVTELVILICVSSVYLGSSHPSPTVITSHLLYTILTIKSAFILRQF